MINAIAQIALLAALLPSSAIMKSSSSNSCKTYEATFSK
jgi:hypothetical protein